MPNETQAPYEVDEALQALGGKVSRNSLYAAINRGEILSVRIGRRILLPKAPFDRQFGIGGGA